MMQMRTETTYETDASGHTTTSTKTDRQYHTTPFGTTVEVSCFVDVVVVVIVVVATPPGPVGTGRYLHNYLKKGYFGVRCLCDAGA